MIAILVIFCQLALSHIRCAPLMRGESSQSSQPSQLPHADVEGWSLKEAWIKEDLPGQPSSEHYTNRVRLLRYDNAFCLDEARAGAEWPPEERKVLACFKAADFYAYLDDTIYVVLQNPHQVIRMTLAEKREALSLQSYFQPTTFEKTFLVMRKYGLNKITESTGLSRLRRVETADDGTLSKSLTLTVLAEMDPLGSGAGKRRFVIGGGRPRQLFAVFNEGDYNFAQFKRNNVGLDRFEFVVKPPGGFWGKMHYFLTATCFDDTANRLATEMRLYASEDIPVRDRSYHRRSRRSRE